MHATLTFFSKKDITVSLHITSGFKAKSAQWNQSESEQNTEKASAARNSRLQSFTASLDSSACIFQHRGLSEVLKSWRISFKRIREGKLTHTIFALLLQIFLVNVTSANDDHGINIFVDMGVGRFGFCQVLRQRCCCRCSISFYSFGVRLLKGSLSQRCSQVEVTSQVYSAVQQHSGLQLPVAN